MARENKTLSDINLPSDTEDGFELPTIERPNTEDKSGRGEGSSRIKKEFGKPKDKGRLEGMVALITGGASEIGKETARVFSEHGAEVIMVVGTEDEKDNDLVNDTKVKYVTREVTKEEDIAEAIEKKVKLDIMVNNAEFLHVSEQRMDEYDMKPFTDAMKKVENVMGGFKHAASLMKSNSCIISTACIAGETGQDTPLAFTTSQHAVIGLTKIAAAKLVTENIRVNCVSSNGNGKFTDIAKAVLFLASKEAEYVSGANLVLDGLFTVPNHS